ncbi:Gfo/Idh/MocA family oxidoreductase [Paenibacillus sp. SYP-B3998]|uniref:Gfo/Idh/MocA family oxidoreductase n=1 Tax=Paenibacillus sp. SYP-B3998 TaxID=2678564 RepID=A0A6G4A3K2_9BACL|nr:Gfo/Idh/MocA family oxidoreductase [Paenibacillus sp. SYP-B3998]NEW08514.1 Gfo/Idh/MocA family oxidoreductase [Paenibacillus sp. SYP-B3998]
MSYLVIGLGSMGKRRVRDLIALSEDQVLGFDLREDRRREVANRFGIVTFDSVEQALQHNLKAIIISTPPDLHMRYAHLAADLNIPFFTEASVTKEGMLELIGKLKAKPDLVSAPSCTMRFHPAVALLRQIVKDRMLGENCFFTYHSGQYLPDWHPYEDYRQFYVSRRETGGCREIVPFEWIWLTSLFGEISKGISMKRKVSSLDVDIDDVYQMVLEFENGIQGQVTVDVVSRMATRTFALIGEKGTARWNFFDSALEVYDGERQVTKRLPITSGDRLFEYEDMYVSEMCAFLQALAGGNPFPHDYPTDLSLLEKLERLEQGKI